MQLLISRWIIWLIVKPHMTFTKTFQFQMFKINYLWILSCAWVCISFLGNLFPEVVKLHLERAINRIWESHYKSEFLIMLDYSWCFLHIVFREIWRSCSYTDLTQWETRPTVWSWDTSDTTPGQYSDPDMCRYRCIVCVLVTVQLGYSEYDLIEFILTMKSVLFS